MNRNRLILACAAVLVAGLWLAWASVTGVQASAGAAAPERIAAPVDEPPVPAPVLERAAEKESEETRAPAEVESPVADPVHPLLLAGIVVDDHGAPVAGARVFVRDAEFGELDARAARLAPPLTTDGSGRFALRESRNALHLVAWASKAGYFDADRVPFDRGADYLELVLRRGGVISGRVLLDPGIPIDAVRLHLESSTARGTSLALLGTHGPGQGEEASTRTPAKDGSFAFEGVPATDARLVVTVQEDSSPLLQIEAIRVREVGESPDARLDPVDLRGLLELLTIEVQDDQGRGCSNATVVLGDPAGNRADRGRLTQDGRTTFLVAAGRYDVDVDLAGWRRAHLSGVHGDQIVHLKKGIPVRVVLGGAVALPAAPNRLYVGLLVDVQNPRSILDGTAGFSEGREASFLVSSPGPHEVAWYVESGTTRYFLAGTPRRTVRVVDQDEEQVIHLDFDPEIRSAWESVLARVASAESAKPPDPAPSFRIYR
jgi:hypothetical protein